MARLTFETDFAHHPLHYFTLLCILLAGLWGIFWFDYNRILQLGIVVSLGVSYIVWGIVHHWYHGDLHVKIVLEYVLVAIMAVLIFASLVIRA
ncbi:MAG: hypothetical protein Q7S31_03860 [bacterium]|nr:hypothetical protein [bacterium]